MLQHLTTLSGSLRAGSARAALPAVSRQARCFGFGSHMSDNDPEVRGCRSKARGEALQAAQGQQAADWAPP